MNPRRGRHYVAAMVLGTAISALGSSSAAAETGEISEGTISSVSRYCTACWRNARVPADRWEDCTQEVLGRLLSRVKPTCWERLLASESDERREFVRAIDTVKKKALRECRRTIFLNQVVADRRGPEVRDRMETRDAVEQAAGNLLNRRQESIVHLSFAGNSVADIARALGISSERVSDEKYKAVRKLRQHFLQVGEADY